MKILIIAATQYELAGTIGALERKSQKVSFFEYQFGAHQVFPVVFGVGAYMTGYGMGKYDLRDIDLAIQIGIGGAYDENLQLGEVVNVVQDCFGDLGVTEANGAFQSVFDLELSNKNSFPFKSGFITSKDSKYLNNLKRVNGITVNNVSGEMAQIELRKEKYPNAHIESMEGAAFLHACAVNDLDCIQLRSISNYVEPRNRANWKIDLALDNLSKTTIELLSNLH